MVLSPSGAPSPRSREWFDRVHKIERERRCADLLWRPEYEHAIEAKFDLTARAGVVTWKPASIPARGGFHQAPSNVTLEQSTAAVLRNQGKIYGCVVAGVWEYERTLISSPTASRVVRRAGIYRMAWLWRFAPPQSLDARTVLADVNGGYQLGADPERLEQIVRNRAFDDVAREIEADLAPVKDSATASRSRGIARAATAAVPSPETHDDSAPKWQLECDDNSLHTLELRLPNGTHFNYVKAKERNSPRLGAKAGPGRYLVRVANGEHIEGGHKHYPSRANKALRDSTDGACWLAPDTAGRQVVCGARLAIGPRLAALLAATPARTRSKRAS